MALPTNIDLGKLGIRKMPTSYKNTFFDNMLKVINNNHPELFDDSYARLAIALISQSLADLEIAKYKEDAKEFFLSNDTKYEFSFINICKNLDIPREKFLKAIADKLK